VLNWWDTGHGSTRISNTCYWGSSSWWRQNKKTLYRKKVVTSANEPNWLTCQDGINALSPGITQPVETLQLIWMQLHTSLVNIVRLFIKLLLQICQWLLRWWCIPSTKEAAFVKYLFIHDRQRTVDGKLQNTKFLPNKGYRSHIWSQWSNSCQL
jgi:hypothetical protein